MALTDPARELVETLALLSEEPNEKIVSRLTSRANVEPWSSSLFSIIFEIIDRSDLVISEVKKLPLDQDVMEDAIRSLKAIRAVFANPKVLDQDINQLRMTVSGANSTVLKMLSSQIRENVSYHKLTKEEREEILQDVNDLFGWLIDLQSDEKSFIRQALIDGLARFIFRLERLEWVGSGYVLEGLRDVIQAYLALEGANIVDDGGDELQKAILSKCKATVVRTLSVLDIVKEQTDRADWALRAYGAVSALADGSTTVTALLS